MWESTVKKNLRNLRISHLSYCLPRLCMAPSCLFSRNEERYMTLLWHIFITFGQRQTFFFYWDICLNIWGNNPSIYINCFIVKHLWESTLKEILVKPMVTPDRIAPRRLVNPPGCATKEKKRKKKWKAKKQHNKKQRDMDLISAICSMLGIIFSALLSNIVNQHSFIFFKENLTCRTVTLVFHPFVWLVSAFSIRTVKGLWLCYDRCSWHFVSVQIVTICLCETWISLKMGTRGGYCFEITLPLTCKCTALNNGRPSMKEQQ